MTEHHASASNPAERRAALGWIAGQLAWESRLQSLRADPEPENGNADNPRDGRDDAIEVDPAA